MTQDLNYDLLIVGGGTVGCCLALSLAKSGMRIGIIEVVDFKTHKHSPGFDGRAIALAWQTRKLLNTYGLGTELDNVLTPIKHIHVSDQGHLGQCRLHHQDHNVTALGYVVELQDIGQVLHRALSPYDIDWLCPRSITDLTQHQQHVEVTLDDGSQISSRLLVAADGGQSTTRTLLNIQQTVDDYQQVAVIANIGLQTPHQGWAYERFTSGGPLALLPMGEHNAMARSSLVWTVTAEQHRALMAMDEKTFLQQLQQAFGYRMGRFIHCGERHSYPLKLIRVQQQIAHRVVLAGNASHSIHPIAGQGFNLGIRDVEGLRGVIHQAWHDKQDIGDYPLLQQYQQSREKDQNTVIQMTDSLVRLFSNQHWPLVVGRNLALSGLEVSQVGKGCIASQAMGNKVESSFG